MFQLIDCARKCSAERLNGYLTAKNLPTIPTNDKDLDVGDEFLKIFNAIESQDDRGGIEVDFQFINDMTGGAETRLLTERATAQKAIINLPEGFDEYGNYDKAFWLYQNAQDLFMDALTDCEIEDMASWITYRVPLVDTSKIMTKTNDITTLVSEHYQNGGRGKYCRAVPIQKKGFVGVAARPLNYAYNVDTYDDEGKSKMEKVASTFNVYFLYIPIKGQDGAYLSVKIKDGGKNNRDVETLAIQFADKVLGTALSESSRVRYKLDKLEDMNASFDTFDNEDGIDNVKITEIVLDHPSFPAKLILQAKKGTVGNNMSAIADCLCQLNVRSLHGFRIVRAIFRFQFKKGKEGKRDWKSKGVVTATVNTNRQSSCNLGISEPHLVARKYLRKWEIERSV